MCYLRRKLPSSFSSYILQIAQHFSLSNTFRKKVKIKNAQIHVFINILILDDDGSGSENR